MRDNRLHAQDTTVDREEVARFAALARQWWDENGSMRTLHRFNPVRIGYIRDQAARNFGRDPRRLDCLAGLRVLDIGCGGGLLSEPLARLGADVVGIDPAEENVEAARAHAESAGVRLDYRATTAEALADAGERFDIVLAMEVVEHVTDVGLFARRAAEMVKPGGMMVAATINRTMKSFALAIVAAEYILGWLPRGTHSWDKFVTPEELDRAFLRAGLVPSHSTGVIYNLFADRWQLSNDEDVNYMMTAIRVADDPENGSLTD